MGLFRRKRREEQTESVEQGAVGVTQTDSTPVAAGEADGIAQPTPADDPAPEQAIPSGPFDAADVSDDQGYIRLGSVWVPGIEGLMMTLEVDEQTEAVTAVRVHLGDSVLQLQAFAAPRSRGIWDEIRAEIAEGISSQGGEVLEGTGPLGAELLVRLTAPGPDGRAATQAMRFLGHDGPRWFLRGVVSGPAAADPEMAAPLVDLMRVVAVSRGDEPRAPRELLPLELPNEEQMAAAAPGPETAVGEGTSTDDLKPFERGPEITEIR